MINERRRTTLLCLFIGNVIIIEEVMLIFTGLKVVCFLLDYIKVFLKALLIFDDEDYGDVRIFLSSIS